MKHFRSSILVGLSAVSGAVWCGCGRDVRLAGKKIHHVQVGPVSQYGLALDQSATPEQVAYVALRAIRDDSFAATPAEREVAKDVQFRVAAADVIAMRNRTSLSRDEYVHHVVTHWTPAVSHYAGDFESDPEKALPRFKNRGTSRSSDGSVAECELEMAVADPSGDPAANVIIVVWLAKDGGYWRVTHFGFEPRRSLANAKTLAAPPTSGS